MIINNRSKNNPSNLQHYISLCGEHESDRPVFRWILLRTQNLFCEKVFIRVSQFVIILGIFYEVFLTIKYIWYNKFELHGCLRCK